MKKTYITPTSRIDCHVDVALCAASTPKRKGLILETDRQAEPTIIKGWINFDIKNNIEERDASEGRAKSSNSWEDDWNE